MWIGYRIISSFGTGLALVLPQVAVQPGLAPQDIPVGISMAIFFQSFGGAIFVSIGNNVFNNKLVQYVGDVGFPEFDASKIVQAAVQQGIKTFVSYWTSDVLFDNLAGLDRCHVLSDTGKCNPFDDDASGYYRADTVVSLVLQRLEDAEADNDPISGVIAGMDT